METARLELFYGPMSSGKTSAALEVLSEFDAMGMKCCYINSDIDNRSTEDFSTSSRTCPQLPPSTDSFKTGFLSSIDVGPYDVIVVDEAQFFDDLYDTISSWLKYNKYYYVVGLSGSYRQKKIGQITDLIPLADKSSHFYAQCKFCAVGLKMLGEQPRFTPAPFTYRLVLDDELVSVGGNDKYASLCRKHFNAMDCMSDKDRWAMGNILSG